MKKPTNIIIYQTKSGKMEFCGDFKNETIWATLDQIADIFEIERAAVTKHLRNIIKDGELEENSVCAIFAHTVSDGKT